MEKRGGTCACLCAYTNSIHVPKLSRTRSSHTSLSALQVILTLAERGDQVGQSASHVHTPRSPLPAFPTLSHPTVSKRCTQVVKPGSPHHVAAYVIPAELENRPHLNHFANEIRCMSV